MCMNSAAQCNVCLATKEPEPVPGYPGAQVPGYPGGTTDLLSHNHHVSVCPALQQYGATPMAASIIHNGHYSSWFASPSPATGTSDLGFNLRAQQRHRDRPMC